MQRPNEQDKDCRVGQLTTSGPKDKMKRQNTKQKYKCFGQLQVENQWIKDFYQKHHNLLWIILGTRSSVNKLIT